MKPKISIHFVDFWDKFQRDSNFLLKAIKEIYEVELDDSHPEIVFFSHFGNDHKKYKKSVLFFFSGEPLDVDFSNCDYALSWRFLKQSNHYRLPLFQMYYQDVGGWKQKYEQTKNTDQLRSIWSEKKALCCMVVSNPKCEVRNEVFHELSKFIPVDSGGRFLNNIGGPVKNKADFIRDYKFVLSFENSNHPGYTTEKIFEPILEGCIPIYWGNPHIGRDVNEKRILNFKNFKNVEDLANTILEIDSNESKALEILDQNIFSDDSFDFDLTKDPQFLNYLSGSLEKGLKRSYIHRKLLRVARTPRQRIPQKVKISLSRLKSSTGFNKPFLI